MRISLQIIKENITSNHFKYRFKSVSIKVTWLVGTGAKLPEFICPSHHVQVQFLHRRRWILTPQRQLWGSRGVVSVKRSYQCPHIVATQSLLLIAIVRIASQTTYNGKLENKLQQITYIKKEMSSPDFCPPSAEVNVLPLAMFLVTELTAVKSDNHEKEIIVVLAFQGRHAGVWGP